MQTCLGIRIFYSCTVKYNKTCKISAASFGQEHTAKIDFKSLMGKNNLGFYHCPFFLKRPIFSVTSSFVNTYIMPSEKGGFILEIMC